MVADGLGRLKSSLNSVFWLVLETVLNVIKTVILVRRQHKVCKTSPAAISKRILRINQIFYAELALASGQFRGIVILFIQHYWVTKDDRFFQNKRSKEVQSTVNCVKGKLLWSALKQTFCTRKTCIIGNCMAIGEWKWYVQAKRYLILSFLE